MPGDQNILVLHRKLQSLNLWQLNENNIEKVLLLAEINKKSDSHITSSNISSKGNYFAFSDSDNTVLFTYDSLHNDIKKIKSFKKLSASFIYFSADEKFLITVDQIKKSIHLYDIKKQITESISLDGLANQEIILSCDYLENSLAFSTLNKNLIFVNLKNKNVEYSLPHPDEYLTQLKFLNNETLITVGEDNKFFLVDIKNKKFTQWTNKNINNFPKNYLRWYNKIMGVTCNQNEKKSDSFLLYTDYNYIKIDLSKEIPQSSNIHREKDEKTRNADWNKTIKDFHKSIFNENYKNIKNTQIESEIFKEEGEEETKINFENNNFKITSRFSSILYMQFLENYSENVEGQGQGQGQEKTLLVIENDWNKILKEFPDTVAKFNYGY